MDQNIVYSNFTTMVSTEMNFLIFEFLGTFLIRSITATNWVLRTGRVCHVWCNFHLITPDYTYRTAIIFGTLKDGSLKINNLSFNINLFQLPLQPLPKWRQRFVKNTFKISIFCQKAQIFGTFWAIRFGSIFPSMWYKYVSNNVWGDLRLPVFTFARVARKSFNGKFAAKNWFANQAFYVTITDQWS